MGNSGLVFGLLDTTPTMGDPAAGAKIRDLTISWMRYGYRDEVLEGPTVTEILGIAIEKQYKHCLILACGSIISEHWNPDGDGRDDFLSTVMRWIGNNDFIAAGRIVGGGDAWYGFDDKCILVNVDRYRQIGAAHIEHAQDSPNELPKPEAIMCDNRIAALQPSGARERVRPRLPGWPLLAACLEEGHTVKGLEPDVLNRVLSLAGAGNAGAESFAPYWGRGIDRFRNELGHDALSEDQVRFLDLIALQTANARKGVFLWNIEPYTDVEETPFEDHVGPVSTLYSVAAGFKPNMILHAHGFDERTRVVFFDYSPNALAVRKRMVQEWDGEDFPGFARYLFREFPEPDTYYHLWRDLTCRELEKHDLNEAWEAELMRWGGSRAFRDHWIAYRELPHDYILGNILTEPSTVLGTVARAPRAVIWWSNAFFTMFSNWFYELAERRRFYECWIERLVAANPEIFVYGSDYNNASVNGIQAGDYWFRYREAGGNELNPCKLHRTEIRM